MNKGLKHSPKEAFQWPAISHEEVVWQESSEVEAEAHESEGKAEALGKNASDRVQESLNRSSKTYYQAALPLLIADRSVAIPEDLSARISAILVEMARFDVELAQRADNVPTMLLRSESAASSQIDRLMSSPQNVALAELYAKAPTDARLVVANMDATKRALELPKGLSLEGILEVHDALLAPQNGQFEMQSRLHADLFEDVQSGADHDLLQSAQSGDRLAHLENANTFNALVAQGMSPVQALEVIHGNARSQESDQAMPQANARSTQAARNGQFASSAYPVTDKTSSRRKANAGNEDHAKAQTTNNAISAHERLRQKPVWLGGTSFTPHTALFVPPAFHRVPDYLEDLIEFGTRADLNPLVKAAILYAQFVTVHPFLIGSGQTGRALIHHIFREDGILSSTIIPVSVGFLHNIDSLLDALHLYREGDPVAIVEELASALEIALYISQVTESSVESLLEDWDGLVGHRKGSKIRQLPKALVKQPVVNSAYLANTLGVTQRTATTLILRACEYGMLRKMGKKERGDFYQSDAIINVLDEINEASTFRTIRV